MRLFFPRRKKQPFRRNSEYLAYFEGKIDQKPRKTSGRLFCMRTSTLARRLRVWEHLFNQTLTQTTHRKRAPFATMTTTTKRDFGVVSMWSQVEAAPKVRALIRFVFYLFRRVGGFRPPKTILCVNTTFCTRSRFESTLSLTSLVLLSSLS